MMNRPATGPHFRPVTHARRAEEVEIRMHRNAAASGHYKDQLLCELELQRTVMAERVRSLEKTRDDLEHEHEALKAFYRESPIGYLTLSARGQILNANEAARALFGMEAAR